MMEVLEPTEQIERVRYKEVIGDAEVIERSYACVLVFKGGRATVRGRDDVETDSWARAVVHIVKANKTKAMKSGGRRGFPYRFLVGRVSPPRSSRRNVISRSPLCLSSYAWRWVMIDEYVFIQMLITMLIIQCIMHS